MPETPIPRNENRLRIRVARLQPTESPGSQTPDYYRRLYDTTQDQIKSLMRLQENQNTRLFDGQKSFLVNVEGQGFFFIVKDALPDQLGQLSEQAYYAPVLCLTRTRVRTPDGIYITEKPVPVLIAHGAALRGTHEISSAGQSFNSEKAFKAVSAFLQTQGLPPIAVFVSCDDASSAGIRTRWDFKFGEPVISFVGGANILVDNLIDTLRRKLDKTLELDQGRMAQKYGATLSSFTSNDPAKKALIEGIFRVDTFTVMRRHLVKAFKG